MSGAFTKNAGTNAIWCRIAAGKIVRSATEDTPGAVKVEKKKNGQGTGEFRWELHDDQVTGKIVGLRVQEQEFGGETTRQLIVCLSYVGERINVTLKEGDRYWRGFMYRLLNIKLNENITFSPYDFETKEGSRKIGLNIIQNEAKVPTAFTKENSGGMPDMQYVMYKGKERPDFSAQDKWLNDNILLPINAKLSELLTVAAGPVAAGQAMPEPEEEDDLPF